MQTHMKLEKVKETPRGTILASIIGNEYLHVEGGFISLQNFNYYPYEELTDLSFISPPAGKMAPRETR